MINRSVKDKLKIKINGFFGPIPTPQKWLFIVGCYNSGTTLLHNLLCKHPEIGSLPNEGQFYTDQFLLPQEEGLPRLWAIEPDKFYLDEKTINGANPIKLKKQWGAHYDDLTKKVLLEKSPTNAGRILWLNKHFENAHFIGIIRNGYAVAEGIRRKAGHDIEKTAIQWATSNKIMLRDLQKVSKKIIIRYEDLTEEPEFWNKQILDFIGLQRVEMNLEDIKFDIHERKTRIKNLNEKSFSNLIEADIQNIKKIAEDLLDKFDYQISG